MLQHPDITKMELYGTVCDEEPVCCCDNCGEEIYRGEEYYEIEFLSKTFCKSCMIEFKKWA